MGSVFLPKVPHSPFLGNFWLKLRPLARVLHMGKVGRDGWR